MSRMKLTDKAVAVAASNDGQGMIKIDDYSQLNEKSVEGLCLVPRRTGGTTGVVYNTGFAVSAMSEANLQGMIYYIKHSKMIGRTCTHAYVELSKSRAMYHQRDMGETHKDPGVVSTIVPKDWPKTLETV